ncbi:MAG TPA: histidine phosphatase family protein [Ktedonobacteraceae bacterium]|nr:histidine phosphatase family protein [Ktedonobacteraceae bacterium]
MTNLYMIRHGEMQLNAEYMRDDGLSPLGRLQAERLRDRLAATHEIQADVLIASTFPRALQTAEIIAPALGLTPILDDDLQEMRGGEAVNISHEEFRKKYTDIDYEETPFRALAPGAENWGQFMLRVGTTLDRIVHEYEGKTIVLVCHGGVIDGSLLYFFRMSALTPPPVKMYTRNTSITHWQKSTNSFGREHWELVKYNDVFHLHDVGTPVRIPWSSLLARPACDDDRPLVPIEAE